MPTFYLNLDTNQVSLQPYDQADAVYAAARGSTSIRLICQRGDVNNPSTVFLDAGVSAGIILRDPANLKGPPAGGPTMLTKGATPADGYIGTTSTDSSFVRDLMHADPADQTAELAEYDLSAVFFALPEVGDHTESTPFTWTVLPQYYVAGTPPADILAVYPTAEQLTNAVTQAAAALHNGDGATFSSLAVSGISNFEDQVNFSATSIFSLAFNYIPNALLATDADSYLSPVLLTAGQGLRRNAANTAFEGYAINTGDGSAFTNLTPANLSGPVPIAKGGTGAATAGAALTALGAEASTNKGTANGYAPLDSGSKVPAAYLPSYVDDVLEFANLAALPGTGETGKIYVTLDTNFEYRWSGSAYIRIVASPGSTDALTEGTTNLYFTASRALAATASAYLAPNGSGANLSGVLHPHPILTSAGGPSGNGTTMVGGTGVLIHTTGGTGTTTGYPIYVLSDTCGTVIFEFNQDVAAGALVATITFATPYTAPLPADVMFCPVVLDHTKTSQGVANPGYIAALEARLTTTTLNIYASADGVGSGSWLAYRYFIPPF